MQKAPGHNEHLINKIFSNHLLHNQWNPNDVDVPSFPRTIDQCNNVGALVTHVLQQPRAVRGRRKWHNQRAQRHSFVKSYPSSNPFYQQVSRAVQCNLSDTSDTISVQTEVPLQGLINPVESVKPDDEVIDPRDETFESEYALDSPKSESESAINITPPGEIKKRLYVSPAEQTDFRNEKILMNTETELPQESVAK